MVYQRHSKVKFEVNRHFKTNDMTILKGFMNFLQWLFIVISVITIIITFTEGLSFDIDLSSTGIQFYLNTYQPFSLIYGATFIVLTTNLGINRFGLLIDSNRATLKIGNRNLWIETINYFLEDVKEKDPFMIKVFKRNILGIHDDLFDMDYKIESKSNLEDFFNKYFKDQVHFLEQMNDLHINLGGIYRDEDYIYSYDNFRYIFANMVKIKDSYAAIMKDLKEFYQTEVKSLPNRRIDKDGFRAAIASYNMTKRIDQKSP